MTATPPGSRKGSKPLRHALTALVILLALFYGTCRRSSYFYEWFWCADSWEAYQVIDRYSREHGIAEVPSRSPMTSSLEFYRVAAHNQQLDQFQDPQPLSNGKGPMPSGRRIYALYEEMDGDFIRARHLKIIYRGRVYPDFVIAVSLSATGRSTRSHPESRGSGSW